MNSGVFTAFLVNGLINLEKLFSPKEEEPPLPSGAQKVPVYPAFCECGVENSVCYYHLVDGKKWAVYCCNCGRIYKKSV